MYLKLFLLLPFILCNSIHDIKRFTGSNDGELLCHRKANSRNGFSGVVALVNNKANMFLFEYAALSVLVLHTSGDEDRLWIFRTAGLKLL